MCLVFSWVCRLWGKLAPRILSCQILRNTTFEPVLILLLHLAELSPADDLDVVCLKDLFDCWFTEYATVSIAARGAACDRLQLSVVVAAVNDDLRHSRFEALDRIDVRLSLIHI